MKKLFFIILLVITSLAFADGGSKETKSAAPIELTGVVLDKTTNETLVGVEIKINDETIYTDLDGKFTTTIYPGEYEVKSSYISYKNISDTINFNQHKSDIVITMTQE